LENEFQMLVGQDIVLDNQNYGHDRPLRGPTKSRRMRQRSCRAMDD
jgi:hypothetical protein